MVTQMVTNLLGISFIFVLLLAYSAALSYVVVVICEELRKRREAREWENEKQ